MRRAVDSTLLALACWVTLCAAGSAQNPAKPADKVVVLVPPFENLAKQRDYVMYDAPDGTDPKRPRRQYRIDRYTEAPRAAFEDTLANTAGVTVVERKRVDTILVEGEFGANSGLVVDSDKSLKLGKMIGANRILIGSIIDIAEETKSFQGYGVKTENTVVTAEVRVRMLDETGAQLYSKTFKGSKTYTKTTFGQTKSGDRHYAAVKEAVAGVAADPKFKEAVLGKAVAADEGLLEVEFAPKPANCDVEIDGKYVGGSPLKRKLRSGTEYKVRISKAGFKEWSGVITPEAGLKITRELEANK